MEWQLLEGVPADDVQRLLSLARRRSFRRGEVVFHRGDPADSLHLVVKGRFAVRVMTPLGDQSTIAVRGPGESFGEMALVGEKTGRSATVEALEAAETFCVLETEFARLRREHPAVNDLLVTLLATEVRRMNERLLEALYLPAERRVLRRLSELADLYAGERGRRGRDPADAGGARRARRNVARDGERRARRCADARARRAAAWEGHDRRPRRARGESALATGTV